MKLLLLFAFAAVAVLTVPAQAADEPIDHVVSFKFKADAPPEKIHEVEVAFAALKQKIPFIQTLDWGTNVSPENHSHGYTHIWIVTFKNAADRDAYLVHPDHKAFASALKDVIDEVFVIDFVPRK